MEGWLTYPLDLSIKNKHIKKAFDVLDGEGGFRYSGLLQELEYVLSIRVFWKTGDRIEGRLRLVRTTLGETLGRNWCTI